MSIAQNQKILKSYRKILHALTTAIDATEQHDSKARSQSIQKATKILNELFKSLDFERGGEVAENLGFIYCFIMHNLEQSATDTDTRALHEAIRLLTPLYSCWQRLDKHLSMHELRKSVVNDRKEGRLNVPAVATR